MRSFYALLALTAVSTIEPAAAQTYGGGYPVCLHVYGPITYFECGYTSIPQCKLSAMGRAAQCEINPYMAQAPARYARRPRHVY